MEIIWPVGTRTGSEFVIELTIAAFPTHKLWPRLKINAAREANWDGGSSFEHISLATAIDIASRMRGVKLEEPGQDDWCETLCAAFPDAKAVGVHRPFEAVKRSHQMLKDSWGMESGHLHDLCSRRADIYQQLGERMFVVDVSDRQAFNKYRFLRFLGQRPNAAFSKFVHMWPVINDYSSLSGRLPDQDITKEEISADDLDRRFQALTARCNPPASFVDYLRAMRIWP